LLIGVLRLLEPRKPQLHLRGEKAMKHRVQEVLLVLIITVISVTVSLFIAHSVQSESLRLKDAWVHSSKGHPTIHNTDTGDVGVIDNDLKESL